MTSAPKSAHSDAPRAEARRAIPLRRLPSTARVRPSTQPPGQDRHPDLDARGNWDHSCLGSPDATSTSSRLSSEQGRRPALRVYYAGHRLDAKTGRSLDGRLLLAEYNCLACHAREGNARAIPLLPPLWPTSWRAVGKRYPDLAPLVPGADAAGRSTASATSSPTGPGRGHRPPRRTAPSLPAGAHAALPSPRRRTCTRWCGHLIATDRVPPRGTATPSSRSIAARQDRYTARRRPARLQRRLRLHELPPGRQRPAAAGDPLNARGPDLSQLEPPHPPSEWFDRWVRNPARIVPRMEMPSVQMPVGGVLDDHLDDQLGRRLARPQPARLRAAAAQPDPHASPPRQPPRRGAAWCSPTSFSIATTR